MKLPDQQGPVDVSDIEEDVLIAPRSIRYFPVRLGSGVDFAAHALASGGVVTQGFANFYAIVVADRTRAPSSASTA